MGMTSSVGSAMACMESLLTHAISFPGEELTENLQIKSPFPEQPGFRQLESEAVLHLDFRGAQCCVTQALNGSGVYESRTGCMFA